MPITCDVEVIGLKPCTLSMVTSFSMIFMVMEG
jgi:hypothetical protein